ncbi:hypothetical protein LTS10_009369 [Elasticomyces elasticus]|nr:hypothetical protein LTS10_009369 [Elasticomyces elasticus]
MSYGLDPPTDNAHWGEEEEEQNPPKLSGPGTSRQTRRLQLRNAGFRAAAVPARKVTPMSVSSSTNWSSVSGLVSGSDAENVSPAGTMTGSVKVEKPRSSGALQDITSGSVTLTRPKKSRPRMSSGRLFAPMSGNYDPVIAEDTMSPPPPKNSIRVKSGKARAKVSKTRRSVSGEARDYIDHLEMELASAQSQLQAVNSPSVTRLQSTKMRTLNTETKQLQDELAEWEARYEQRVQEVIDEHFEIEAGLRSQLRKLEQEAEEAKYRVEEMEIEVAETRQNMEAAEAANVNLERRLEIMSGILATSPTKIDLHATPGMGRKHQRPKSMLPRFPTASSLLASPERPHRAQPPSPMIGFADDHHSARDVLDTTFSQSDMLSDAESVFSEAPPSAGGSLTSVEHSDTMPNFNPWTLQAVQSAKARPARRMRRFGPGSHGPKPLILPSTSYFEHMPATAPPLERSETVPAFSFPFPDDLLEEEDSPSSLVMRRRASTTADETTLANLAASPFGNLLERSDPVEESMLSTPYPISAESRVTSRNFSSLGSVAGRNLMDELCAVRTADTPGGSDEPSKLSEELERQAPESEDAEDDTLLLDGKEDAPALDDADNTATMAVSSSYEPNDADYTQLPQSSIWTRFRFFFGDLWRTPVGMAQHLIQQAQSRIHIPEPLRNVQWWLVGVLLGPMAKRHLLSVPSQYNASSDLERQPLLRAYTAPTGGQAEQDGLAYGTMYHTPPASPARTGAEPGKQVRREGCPHHHQRSRHSPWVWVKFSITLAVAVGVAFKDGPASLLRNTVCGCRRKERRVDESASARNASIC